MRIPNAIAVYSSVAGMHTAVREAIERSPLRDALATVPVLDVDKADPAAPSSPLRTAEILLADPPLCEPVLHDATGLRWVQSTFAGVDALVRAVKRTGNEAIVCTRASGLFGPLIAEYTVGWLVTLERGLLLSPAITGPESWARVRPAMDKYRTLAGRTLGILGVGEIGQEIARYARAMRIRTLGLCRAVPAADSPRAGVVDAWTPDLREVLRQSDAIVSVLPNTPETTGLLDGDVLAVCAGRRPVFINAGRSNVVTEATIVRALQEDWLSHAVLDVFDTEPLPEGSPLLALPPHLRERLHITPHVAAHTEAQFAATLFASNLERYMRGEPLQNVVDWDKGY